MMRLHNICCATAILFCATASFPAERLTVDQAVELALKKNLRLQAVEKRAGGSHDTALSVGARLLPSVNLTEEYQHWDCPFAIDFMTFMGGCQTNPMQFVVRKSDTNSFVAAVRQPIVGLLHTGFDFSAQQANAKSVDAGVKTSRAAVTELVRAGYLRYFEARALEQIAGASVAELADQVKVNEARLKAGVITNADLLRVTVALANAQQQQMSAHAAGIVARAQLLDAVGLPVDADVEFVEPTTLLTFTQLPEVQAATSEALRKRPEVEQLRLAEKAADRNRTARYLSLLPEVDAEGAYVRTDGQLFAPANQWFVGVRASWAIWEWGATFFQARAASRQAEASTIEAENQRRQVAVEVQNARANSEAFAAAVDVAQKAISSAQEAYRVTLALVQAGSATTTDLLESQSALTTARLNLARAQYDLAIQRVALARAMGD